MKNNILTILIYIIIFLPVTVYAKSLSEFIKEKKLLNFDNVYVIDHEHAKYLVSVGASTIATSSPSDWKEARIKAKLLSQQQLSRFINDININASETIEDVVVFSSTDNGIKTRRIDSNYTEIIKETSEGTLTNIITIGEWSDKNNYYYAIGKKLKE